MKKVLIIIVILMTAITAFGEKIATLPELLKPFYMVMDNEQIYVCDGGGVLIYIYSRKDFKLKTKFGKMGEGPQEFRLQPGSDNLTLFPYKDYLLISSIRRASFYSIDGKFIKDVGTELNQAPGRYQAIGDKFVGMGMSMGGDMTFGLSINLYDKNFKRIKELYKPKINFMEKGAMTFPMVNPLAFAMDNRIIVPGGNAFALGILDADGNKVAAITREYKPLKVGEDYKKGVHDFFKTNPSTKAMYELFLKDKLKFTDYFPPIQFIVVDSGKIYIQTYLKKDGKYEFFIYDINGKFLKRLFIPIKYRDGLRPFPFTIKDNTRYQLVENEDEEVWELHGLEIK
ncbi:MAG: hypothetical protein GY950_28555 [bacterium]|nr:hypothetical protein [bacterium]